MELVLGTARIGMKDYGIASSSKYINYDDGFYILQIAYNYRIRMFDTSPLYEKGERLLGLFRDVIDSNFSVITKLPRIINSEILPFKQLLHEIRNKLNISLRILRVQKVNYYLLHYPDDVFLRDGILIECLKVLKKEGLIEHIGVSIYNTIEISEMNKYEEIDCIEIPVNLFDHRILKDGLLKKLKAKGYTIFARSVFLQGLFFLDPYELPDNIKDAERYLRILRILCNRKYKIDELALLFIKQIKEIDYIIIGVESKQQLKRNITIMNGEKELDDNMINDIMGIFSNVPENVINPTMW